MPRITTLFIKEQIDPEGLASAAAVVIDVFLSTTTIVTVLERGACRVHPAPGPDAARAMARQLGPGTVLLGGEEQGLPVAGFDRGPFPHEYAPEDVAGRTVIFTSTNGTRAMHRARTARPLLLACLRNAPATAAYLRRVNPERLYLIACGSRARLALEDLLCAGLIAALFYREGTVCDDATWLAMDFARRHLGPLDALGERSVGGHGGEGRGQDPGSGGAGRWGNGGPAPAQARERVPTHGERVVVPPSGQGGPGALGCEAVRALVPPAAGGRHPDQEPPGPPSPPDAGSAGAVARAALAVLRVSRTGRALAAGDAGDELLAFAAAIGASSTVVCLEDGWARRLEPAG
ncbi:MAG TPA: 2-phosphosulfolactate phosphatase [Thermaerobacter sp.]